LINVKKSSCFVFLFYAGVKKFSGMWAFGNKGFSEIFGLKSEGKKFSRIKNAKRDMRGCW